MLLIPGTNLHTTIFTSLVKRELERMVPRTIVDLKPQPPRESVVTQVDPTLKLEVASEDYEDAGIAPADRIAVARLNDVLPRSDPNDRWASAEEASQTLSACFGRALRPVVLWEDPESDVALQRYVSQGLAAHMLEANEQGYVVDLSFMDKYEVRSGFQRYGAVLHLSPALEPVSIDWGGRTAKPGSDRWEEAKLVFRSSTATAATIRDHAVRCHMLTANGAVVATRRSLPPAHPIRRLLMPFQYRTPTINWDALLLLVGPRAIFHRLFAFEWSGLDQLYGDAKNSHRMETLPAELARKRVADVPGYAYAEDGLEYWSELRRFVEAYVGLYFERAACPDDDLVRWWNDLEKVSGDVMPLSNRRDLVELCTYLIFMATGYHAQVGAGIGDNVAHLALGAPNVRQGRSVAEMLPSKNTMYQAYMLGALTNFRMPELLEDFSHLMLDAEARAVVADFRAGLSALSLRLGARNRARAQPMPTFDPRYLELSVSI
jgi:hypothetical protein